MKIYIASKFENKENVRNLIKECINMGHTVPYDWTYAGIADIEQACFDLEGVRNCDILVGLFNVPDVQYKGAIAEVGMAMALNKNIYIFGNYLDSMVFMFLKNVKKVSSNQELFWQISLLK